MNKLLVGVIAILSVPALAQDRVSKFDINGDLRVDYVELTNFCKVSMKLFETADKNGDGLLSNNEMRIAKEYLFSKCDKAKNA